MTIHSRGAALLDAWFRPALTRLPAPMVVKLYSRGRSVFLQSFLNDRPEPAAVPAELGVECWGLRFRSPILNAAGMFKTGGGYEVVSRQGAGGFLAGTTTGRPRQGNRRHGVTHPFVPYPRSGAASNWLGLPNPGHRAVAAQLASLPRVDGCPVAVSLSADPDPDIPRDEKLEALVAGLRAYDAARVDWIEINESCPNTEAEEASFDGLVDRLGFLAESFLKTRERSLPVVVKFSNDTAPEQLPRLLDTLIHLGFDGVNFGNTSVAYQAVSRRLVAGERRLLDHFVGRYGGGVSGRPLKEASLKLVGLAADHVASLALDREFHILRTGGVETALDVRASLDAGASLVQWYTGYFEAFGRHGHSLYKQLYGELLVR